MKKPLIKLENVSKYYKTPTGVSEGMRHINLEFFNNEFIAITGESGSGKTTLLNVISGLDSYEDGELYINGIETSHYSVKDFEKFRAANIGFVFQNYNVIESYTVYQNIVIALEAQNYPADEIKERALDLIDRVGLSTHKNHRTAKLSGGQKQRVVIARALAKDAPIILADEPTGNLDSETSEEILTLLKEISEDKLVVLVSHNLEEVKKYATRNIVLEDGNVKNDIVLEKREYKEANIVEDYSNNKPVKKGALIALRNIKQTPKRSIFQVILSMVVVFTFIFFYASLIKNTGDQNSFGVNDDYLYISKRDDTSFNDSDIVYLNSKMRREMTSGFYFKNVISSSFLSGIETEFENDYEYKVDVSSSVNIKKNQLDLYREEVETLNSKLPTEKNEILLGGYRYLYSIENKVGDTIKINNMDFIISGFVLDSRGEAIIFFHEDFLFNGTKINDDAKFLFNDDFNFDIIEVRGMNRVEIKLLMDDLNKTTYQIIDPYGNLEVEMKTINSFLLVFMWIVLLLILQVIFFVLYQVQKNMMSTRKIDFAVYRSIGISEQEVAITVIIEQLIIALVGSLLVFIILKVLSVPFYSVYIMIRHLKLFDYLIITLLLVLLAVRMAMRFNKKVFNLTVIDALKEDL